MDTLINVNQAFIGIQEVEATRIALKKRLKKKKAKRVAKEEAATRKAEKEREAAKKKKAISVTGWGLA